MLVDSPNCPDGGDGRNPGGCLVSHPANCVCDPVRSRSRHRSPGKEDKIESYHGRFVEKRLALFDEQYRVISWLFPRNSILAKVSARSLSAIKTSRFPPFSGFLGARIPSNPFVYARCVREISLSRARRRRLCDLRPLTPHLADPDKFLSV